jgi:outer membrane protein OmpA-like peptidoglycan-associated protein
VKGIKYIFLFVFCFGLLRSQSDTSLARRAGPKVLKRLGRNAMRQKDPSSAITFYERYLKIYKKNPDVMYDLGVAYLQVRDYERAQHMFLNAYKGSKKGAKGKSKLPEALYYHAQMQKANGLYDSAKANFATFKKEYKGRDKVMKKQAGKEISFCDSVHKLVADRKKISIARLDTTINKVNTEGSPVMLDDFTMLYTSLRTEKKEIISEEDTGNVPKRKLYYATKKGGRWKFAGEYGSAFNDKDFNTGNFSFSPDRKRMYFTRCKPNYKGEMICAIYVSEKDGSEWTEPVKLPGNVNNPKYTSTMPSVTKDPVKGSDIIYFVSNRKKGRGGLDIWYTVYNKKTNTYREPKNAGSKINTSQNEISPYFDMATQSLYFSSDGMGGLGGYDVYKAIGDGKRWTSVDNIGQPINTGADEIYFTIADSRREGFFVSNRKGGNALKNTTCCDDIYSYYNNQYIDINVKGNVHEVLDPFEMISGATIEVFLKDPKTNDKFLVKTVNSDSKGNYQVNLEPDHDYVLVAKKDDYLASSEEISTRGIFQSMDLEKDLQLMKRPKGVIHIPNIQYGFNSANVVAGSETIIDTTILKLMLLNPEIIVEIHSHTDGKGSDKFNLKLSQKRAESVVFYLVSKGIDPKRLRAIGFGESKPLVPNENPDGTDNPEGRAKNRRTDFKIIGTVDSEIINDSGTD